MTVDLREILLMVWFRNTWSITGIHRMEIPAISYCWVEDVCPV